jgi:hypothetical protein
MPYQGVLMPFHRRRGAEAPIMPVQRGILQLEALEGGMNSDLYHDLEPLVCISHNAEAP